MPPGPAAPPPPPPAELTAEPPIPPENLVEPKLADEIPPEPPAVNGENEPPVARTPVAVEVGAEFAVGLNQVDPPLELAVLVPIDVNIC